MGFDADMHKVTERYKKWADTAIITNDAFSAVDGLVQKHYDERGRLFDELQNALKRDTDIQSPWDNLCDKGLGLTEVLNNEIARRIPDGFKGLGMTDFYEGERAAWQNCKSGRIGLIAETFHDIAESNVEIYKKLEVDLKNAREDSKLIDDLARATFGDMRENARGVVAEGSGAAVSYLIQFIPFIGEKLAPKAKAFVQVLIKGSASVRELTKRKSAAKGVLLRNVEIVAKAQNQIGDSAIRDILKRAQDLATSWKGASRGDYNALDWASFGQACVEILLNKAAPLTEKAKMLFENMKPMYIEALTTSFITLFSDPATLENFNGQLSTEVQKLFDDLSKDEIAIASLRDNEAKRSAAAQMKEIVDEVTEALADLKAAIREIEEKMKM